MERTGHPALRDRNVRLALAHATDKQNIIDVILLGLGAPGLWWGLTAGLTGTAVVLIARFVWLTARPIARA